jgi:HD-like signal output (HDOD) protein
MPTTTSAVPDVKETAQTRARLIKKFGSDGDLLSLGVATARVVELTSSDGEAAKALAYYVLADVALTQKILRLANTVTYRSVANTPITTISRAIFVLGFDMVKTCALALMLVENLGNAQHANAIRQQLIDSLCASLIGRELARHAPMQGAEEASIAALFNNLGRMLMASHEHELYEMIEARVADGASPAQGAIQIMGCTFEFLTETVLREWNFPEFLVHAQERLAPGPVPHAKSKAEWVRQVVSFSAEAAQLAQQPMDTITPAAVRPLMTRYGAALQLDLARLRELFTVVGREIAEVVASLNLALPAAPEPAPAPTSTLPSVLKLAMLSSNTISTEECYDSGKPINARDRLLQGVQLVTRMMGAGGYKPSALSMLVIETLYSSMGFRFATVCLKDGRNETYRAVLSVGEQNVARQPHFVFPTERSENVFHLALENNADLMIEETTTGTIRELIPAWHKKLLPDTRSMMILPLVQNNTPLGLFYADRVQPAPEGVSSEEAALIKALVTQMMTAVSLR